MSGTNPTPPPDAGTDRKRKWMEEMADITLSGPAAKRIRYLHSDDEVQNILGDYYDVANTTAEPMPEHPTAVPFTPADPAPMQPAATRQELFQAMAHNWQADDNAMDMTETTAVGLAPSTTTTTAGPLASLDTDVDMGVGGTPVASSSSTASTGGRPTRVHNRPKDYDPGIADPGESPEDNPFRYDALRQTIRPDNNKARTATAYGGLAEQYFPKGTKKNPNPGVRATKMPGPVWTPQTDSLAASFATSSEFAQETTDYQLTKLDDPDPSAKGSRDLGWQRLTTGLNGPHSVAFSALNTALAQRMSDANTGASVQARNEKRRLHLDKMFALNDVPPPGAVMEILIEEEPHLYKSKNPDKPEFADTAPADRRARIVRYYNAYSEIYNQVVSVIAGLARTDLDMDEQTKGKLLAEAFGRTEELVNLHPYQTYGWRGDDPAIERQEIGGKGEGAAADELFGADSSADTRISGMGRLVDGFDPARMFKNPERYRQFLIGRIEFLVGDSSPQFTAHDLSDYPIEVLFDLMLIAKQGHETAKAAAKAAAAMDTTDSV